MDFAAQLVQKHCTTKKIKPSGTNLLEDADTLVMNDLLLFR